MMVKTMEMLESSWRVPDEEKEKQRKQFELYARDLATKLHMAAKEKEDKTLHSRAADAYACYLEFFDEESLSVDILHNQAEAFFKSERYLEAAHAYEMLASREPPEAEKDGWRRKNLYGAVVSYHKSLKNDKDLDDLDKMEAREGLRQTGKHYLAEYPKSKEAPEVGFNVAWVSYEQGDYGAALDNLDGLIKDARQFLANTQITDPDFRKDVETILVAAENRHMEELTIKVKDGVDGSEKVLLALGSEARDSGMRETALFNLFVVSKEEENIPKILDIGGQILQSFPKSKHRKDVTSTIAHFYLKAADFPNAAAYAEQTAALTGGSEQAEHWLRAAQLRGWMGQATASAKDYQKALSGLAPAKQPKAKKGLLNQKEALTDRPCKNRADAKKP